jgi:hypothetical protein
MKGGNNIGGATTSSYTAKTAGTYKVNVTGANGCSKISKVRRYPLFASKISVLAISG